MPEEDDDLDRRVRKLTVEHAETRWFTLRLDDDVKELRDELRAVRATQQEHTRRFDTVETTLDSVETTLEEHTRRLGSVETTLHEHPQRFDSVQTTLQEHSQRFDSVGAQLRSLTQLVGQVLDRLPEPGPGD